MVEDPSGFDDAVARAAARTEFQGVWTTDGTWDDFLRGKSILSFDPLYGHRLSRGRSLVYDRKGQRELLMTDADGFVPNSVDAEATGARIARAREKGRPVVFVLGGSTIFGTGARTPDKTIPALLEAALERRGTPAVVVNAGVGSWQSYSQLRFLLHEVLPRRPDAVVFYDGWNDCKYLNALLALHGDDYVRGRGWETYSALRMNELQSSFARLAAHTLRLGVRLAFERTVCRLPRVGFALHRRVLLRLAPRVFESPGGGIQEMTIDPEFDPRSVDIYAENLLAADALCRLYGTRFLHFLQPVLILDKKPKTAEEARVAQDYVSATRRATFRSFYDAFEQRRFKEAGRFAAVSSESLRDAFIQSPEPLYIDTGHLNPEGNRLVAERIAEPLARALGTPAPARSPA